MEVPPDPTFQPVKTQWARPGWSVFLTLSAGLIGTGIWLQTADWRTTAEVEQRGRAAAEKSLSWAIRNGAGSCYKLLPSYLPKLIAMSGKHQAARELAIAALCHTVSFSLPHLTPEPPAFTPDGRWVIQILTSGDVLFSETVFLNAPQYKLTAQAASVRVPGDTLYLLDSGIWTKRRLDLKPGAKAALGMPEPLDGHPPDEPTPAIAPPFKIAHSTETTLVILAAADGTTVRFWSHANPPALTGVLSPDGRFLAVHERSHALRIWNLQRLREELAKLQLDWEMPPFQDPREDETDWGLVTGNGVRGFAPFELPTKAQPARENKKIIPVTGTQSEADKILNRGVRRRVVLSSP